MHLCRTASTLRITASVDCGEASLDALSGTTMLRKKVAAAVEEGRESCGEEEEESSGGDLCRRDCGLLDPAAAFDPPPPALEGKVASMARVLQPWELVHERGLVVFACVTE